MGSDQIAAIARNGANDPAVELVRTDAPVPGPSEALIEVRASTINRGELSLLAARDDGWRPGQDFAGIVVAEAAGGGGPTKGAAVFGTVDGGAWSERVAASVGRLAPLPGSVSFEQAAGLGIAGLTALRVVRRAGSILGRRVLVTAPGGGVGPLISQLAKLAGAEVSSDASDGPFAAALDGIGGRMIGVALGALSPGGRVVVYGASDPEPSEVSLAAFFGHEGASIHSFMSFAASEDDAEDLAILAGLVADGRLESPVAATYALRDTSHALERLAARGIHGKLVVRPNA